MITSRSASVTAVTHRGLVRPGNEDTVVVGNWIRNASMDAPVQSWHEPGDYLLCMIADGMGGHAAGEEASRLAAFLMSERVAGTEDEAGLAALLREVNKALFIEAQAAPRRAGMGTTVVGLILRPADMLYFNVGDSRLYRFRDGFLQQLSLDDVPPETRDGELAGCGPRSGILTQCLGGSERFIDIAPHVGIEPVVPGWAYLLCSDGLTDLVALEEIEAILGRGEDEEAVRCLLDAALKGGGLDNVSILLVRITPGAATEGWPGPPQPRCSR